MFGSRYNLHVAMAWKERENNPELVQDEHQPRTRSSYEKDAIDRELEAPSYHPPRRFHLPGRIVSTSAVFGPDTWRKRSKRQSGRRKRAGRRGSLNDSSLDKDRSAMFAGGADRRWPNKLDPLVSLGGRDERRGDPRILRSLGLLDGAHEEFLAQYQAYTATRKHLEDEGFFDEQGEKRKFAGEEFGFNEQEILLARLEAEEAKEEENEDFSREVAKAGQRERQKAGRRVVISTVLTDSDGRDTGIDTHFDSRENTGSDLMTREIGGTSDGAGSGMRDGTSTGGSRSPTRNERGSSVATGTPDLMSRFYARLQELKETKEEDERGVSSGDVSTRNKDRLRIKTALRRLLNSRLFPDKAIEEKSGKLGLAQDNTGKVSSPDDGSSASLASGTVTPMTLGSRSNTFSLYSRQNTEDVPFKSGTRGKVIFVGESSHLTTSSTDGPDVNDNSQESEQHQEEPVERVAYYRRHPLGPLKTGAISRLYQPARPPSRSKTSLSQSSLHRDGLRRDRAFLQRLQGDQGVREDTRWSVPGEKGPDDYCRKETSPQRSGWRGERIPTSAWSYNMTKVKGTGNGANVSQSDSPAKDSFWLKDVDDLDLRKLLEELYCDKKYMDRIIKTMEINDQTEEEVCNRLEDGRDYLLNRAKFWREKGPLPPRPPTTQLGLRLQRERTMQSRMTSDHDGGALSRQRTDISLANEQESRKDVGTPGPAAGNIQHTQEPKHAEVDSEVAHQQRDREHQKAVPKSNKREEKEVSRSQRRGTLSSDGAGDLSEEKHVSDHNAENPSAKGDGDDKEEKDRSKAPPPIEYATDSNEGDQQMISDSSQDLEMATNQRKQSQEPLQQEKREQDQQEQQNHQQKPHQQQNHNGPYQANDTNRFQKEEPTEIATGVPKEDIFIISK